MFKEELRTHITYSGKRFWTFPIMVFIFSSVFALSMKRLLVETTLDQLMVLAIASSFLYGLSVGSFGFMGRQFIEKRFGTQNYLVATPSLLPITYRQTFLGLYIRDSVFYILLVLVPAVAGLFLAAPIAGFNATSILLFFAAALMSFQLGTSLSFFGSVLYNRNLTVFFLFTGSVIAIVFLGGVLSMFEISLILPALSFEYSVPPFGSDYQNALAMAVASIAATAILTALALVLLRMHFTIKDVRHEQILPRYLARFKFAKGYGEIVSKEFVDIKRSGTVSKMFFSFVLPLVFLSFTSWFINTGLGITVGFNTVFYGAMVGFLGVLLYSWLNNVDGTDYYSLLPMTVPQVIRARLIVFLLLTFWISAIFVVGIAAMNNELDLLWLALIVMIVTSIYMVVMIAYLTGLRTNSFLFDMGIMGRFAIMSFLPDVCLTILSFTIRTDPFFSAGSILLVLAILIGATLILFRGIEDKWRRNGFNV